MPSNQTTNPISFRKIKTTDIPFIMDSWIKSWRQSAWAGTVPNNLWAQVQRDCIEQLIARGAEFDLAVSTEHPDLIVGWVCYELTQDTPARTVIHYLYVKDPYLRVKPPIAETLVARSPGRKPGYYTHRYRLVAEFCGSREGWRHAPEIARRAYGPDTPGKRTPKA